MIWLVLILPFIISFLFMYIHHQKTYVEPLAKRLGDLRSYGGYSKSTVKKDKSSNRSQRLEKRLKEILKQEGQFYERLKHLFYRVKINDFLFFYIVGAAISFFFFFLLFENFVFHAVYIAAPLAVALTVLILYVFMITKESTWVVRFNEEFLTALDIMIRSLSSGLTIQRGISMAAREAQAPVSYELGYILAEVQLGMPLDQAMMEASERVGIEDFRFFVTALTIQGKAGGNLSQILKKIADLIRDRKKFENKIHTLVAEPKFNAIIISAIPVLLISAMFIFKKDYLDFFLHTPSGQKLSMFGLTLMAVGFTLMSRVIKVNI
jgi:Flp pilus assembly protein TadB